MCKLKGVSSGAMRVGENSENAEYEKNGLLMELGCVLLWLGAGRTAAGMLISSLHFHGIK